MTFVRLVRPILRASDCKGTAICSKRLYPRDMAPTTVLALSASLPADVLSRINSFRRECKRIERTERDLLSLRRSQRQWRSLQAKVLHTGRLDVGAFLPPFPLSSHMTGAHWTNQENANVCFEWFRQHYNT